MSSNEGKMSLTERARRGCRLVRRSCTAELGDAPSLVCDLFRPSASLGVLCMQSATRPFYSAALLLPLLLRGCFCRLVQNVLTFVASSCAPLLRNLPLSLIICLECSYHSAALAMMKAIYTVRSAAAFPSGWCSGVVIHQCRVTVSISSGCH